MSDTIRPAIDEELDVLEDWDFETLSREWALELIARIRADAEKLAAVKAIAR